MVWPDTNRRRNWRYCSTKTSDAVCNTVLAAMTGATKRATCRRQFNAWLPAP